MLGQSSLSPNCALHAWLQSAPDPFLAEDELSTVYQLFQALSECSVEDQDVDAARLLLQFMDDDRFTTFLVASKSDAPGLPPRMELLHSPKFLPARLGRSSPHFRKHFCSVGPAVDGHFITAACRDLFQLKTCQVKTPATVQETLLAYPEASCLDMSMLDQSDIPTVESVIVPNAIWLPFQYAKLCVDHELTPSAVWKRIYPTILSNGHATACKPLIQFLQAAACHHDDAPRGLELEKPIPDLVILKERAEALRYLHRLHSMPNPMAASPASFPDMTALIQALRASTVNAPLAPLQVAPTTPEEFVEKRWLVNQPSLLKLNLVSRASQLPPLWAALARGPRKEERNILQSAYEEYARSEASLTTSPLIIPKELCTSIMSLSFWAGDPDRLDEGLHPFRTIYTSVRQTSNLKSLLTDYDLLASEGTITANDIARFRMIFKSQLPTCFTTLDATLKIFFNFISILFTPTHPFRLCFQAFLNAWTPSSTLLSEVMSESRALPASFLRSIQLQCALYWQSVNDSRSLDVALAVPPPELVKLLHSFRVQAWIPPSMPGLLDLEGMYSNAPPATPAIAPVRPAPPAALPFVAPRPPAPPAAPPVVDPPSRRVNNPARIPAMVVAMQDRVFRLRDLLTDGVQAPATDGGGTICLSFHLKFYCYSDCNRCSTHRALTAAETTRLAAFVAAEITTPNVGRE